MKKEFQLLTKEDIKKRLALCAFIKYLLLIISASIITWKIFEFRSNLYDVNQLINNETLESAVDLFKQAKEMIIKEFVIDLIWRLTITTVILILIIIIESNTEDINTIDDTTEQIIENISSREEIKQN